jgi:hypothetical protein
MRSWMTWQIWRRHLPTADKGAKSPCSNWLVQLRLIWLSAQRRRKPIATHL